MKKSTVVLAMSIALVLIPPTPASAEGKQFSASLGESFGGFIPSFTVGMGFSFPLQRLLRGEFDFFYYRNPLEKSRTPGLAITSTGVGTNFSYIFLIPLKNPALLPYACLSLGWMYLSETWEYDRIGKEFFHSWQMDIALGGGVDWFFESRFGLRFDSRLLFLFQKDKPVLRITVGFLHRF